MDAHLTDSHDRAMTTEAVHGTANADPAGTRISPHSRLIANSSATRQSGDAIVIAAQTVAVNHGQRLLGGTIARSRGAARPSCCLRSPLKERAQGKPGARRTRSLARNKKAHERSHHRFTETIRPSLRDGFTAYTCSPRCAGLFGHHIRAKQSFVASATTRLRALRWIPASGYQDHTTSPSATAHAPLAQAVSSIAARTRVS